MTPTSLDTALEARAQLKQQIVDVDEPSVKLVVVRIGHERFAFHASHIREILSDQPVFTLPGSPDSLEGVIHVRGNIESVVRLNRLLQQPEDSDTSHQRILMGKTDILSSGIRVDEMIDLFDTVISSIQPPPATLPAHLAPLVSGVIAFHQQPLAILDLAKIFTHYLQGQG